MDDFDSISYLKNEIWTISQQNIPLLYNFSSKLISCFRILWQKVYPGKWHIPGYPQHSKYPPRIVNVQSNNIPYLYCSRKFLKITNSIKNAVSFLKGLESRRSRKLPFVYPRTLNTDFRPLTGYYISERTLLILNI